MNKNIEEMNAIAQKAKKELQRQKNDTSNTNANIDYSALINEQNGNTPQQQPQAQQQQTQKESADLPDGVIAPAPEIEKYDDELFPGGPTKTQLELWKKDWDGYDIYVIELLNKYTFVFRTLGRFEYKQLVSFADINALQREEAICNATILWPENYNCSEMAAKKAGIPSTLSAVIMEKSGFTKDYVIEEV